MGIESAKVAEKKTTRHQKESRQKSRQDSLKAHRHSEKKKPRWWAFKGSEAVRIADIKVIQAENQLEKQMEYSLL